MNNNLPTTPGVYWWRAKDGDEWRAIILTHVDIEAIQEDIPEFGEAYIDGMTISGGQWAKAHTPDGGVEAWAVFNGDIFFVAAPTQKLAKAEASKAMFGVPDFYGQLEALGGTCEPVTIYRNEKE